VSRVLSLESLVEIRDPMRRHLAGKTNWQSLRPQPTLFIDRGFGTLALHTSSRSQIHTEVRDRDTETFGELWRAVSQMQNKLATHKLACSLKCFHLLLLLLIIAAGFCSCYFCCFVFAYIISLFANLMIYGL